MTNDQLVDQKSSNVIVYSLYVRRPKKSVEEDDDKSFLHELWSAHT